MISVHDTPASKGRYARYEKTQLGMWTSLGNDLSMLEPKRQTAYLKINKTGSNASRQIDYSDPMAFLTKCELKQKTKHTKSGRAAYVPLMDYNCPSIRKVAQMEKAAEKNIAKAYHESERMQQHTYAHNEGHQYEATSLGVYAILPKEK